MKRTFDFIVATVGLVATAPLVLVLIILIRWQSSGPAIFAQRRVGRNGEPFVCYKLRTMYDGTAHGPTHTTAASAITPIGGRLRRWKLDELPQFFNVVRGDMSLVGPRPCLESQVDLIKERQRLGILSVRPGITGLAQVEGVDMSDTERLAYFDAKYVEAQSLALDLKLLVATALGRGIGIDRIAKEGEPS